MTKAITSQRKQLYKLFKYDKETEALHVSHVTNNLGTTAKDLSIDQAAQLIQSLTKNWAVFNINNNQHKYILSLLRQLDWTTIHEKYGVVADMNRLSAFLKSKKSPVPKPLQDMTLQETSKPIVCLESMIIKTYK
ncbi:MAG TPA: hypothetical protein DHV22_16910 [Xanthomarina gelatinilytica]|uniref:Uncharacterized protein n=1 Tax=Xanthomarina gelatinilytica TaxID=1137281 RepID=A0A3D6BYP3_9FLAO|nr:hypothetical protein [Xanthomarina gelatinilytica]